MMGQRFLFSQKRNLWLFFCFIGDFGFTQKRNGEAVLSSICRKWTLIKRQYFYLISGTAVEDFLKLCLRESHAVRRVRKIARAIFAGVWGVPNKQSECALAHEA